jgi:hypothetical protein
MGSCADRRYGSFLMNAENVAATPSIIPDSLTTPENAKMHFALAIGALLALKILRIEAQGDSPKALEIAEPVIYQR